MFKHLMLVVSISLLVAHQTPAAQRTVIIGGKKVTLTVADDVFLVKPEAQSLVDPELEGWETKTKAFLKEVIITQAEQLKGVNSPTVALDEVVKNRPRVVPSFGGLLVPRISEISTSQIHTLASSPALKLSGASVAYRFNGSLLLVKTSVTVLFRELPPDALIRDLNDKFKLKELSRPSFLDNAIQFELGAPEKADAFRMSELLRDYLKDKIHWAEPDLVHEVKKSGQSPNDTYFNRQWYAEKIQAPKLWSKAQPKKEVLVAILDDGVDNVHEDLKDRLIHGRNFVHLGKGVRADTMAWQPGGVKDNHGTPCAGLIAAIANNKQGVAGLAREVKVIPVRVTGEGFVDEYDIAHGFEYAKSKNAKVISCSLDFTGETSTIRDSIKKVIKSGCLVVAAVGNDGPYANVEFPASLDGVIGVGATKKDDTLWEYSNRGPDNQVTLVAPSGSLNYGGIQGIWSTDRMGKYGLNDQNHKNGWREGEPRVADLEPVGDEQGNYTGRFGGTSAAAPMVAAVAATLWACYPSLEATDIRKAIIEGADKVQSEDPFAGWKDGYSKLYGYGRLNAAASLERAEALDKGSTPPSPAPPPTTTENPKILATNKTIDTLFQDRPILVEMAGEKIRLDPSPRWVIVLTSSDTDIAEKTIEAVVQKKRAGDPAFVQRIYEDKEGTFNLYKVAKVGLKSNEELLRIGRSEGLPIMYPVYLSEKGEIVFRGTVTTEIKVDHKNAESIKKSAERWGLELIPETTDQKQLQFRLKGDGECRTPFEASKMLGTLTGDKLAKPDILTQIKNP